jgi:hypothetical protein
MPDFNVRADSINVEQIMEQIRARIREKRGVDYTEQEIRDLAAVKLEKFLDPRGVRSDLLAEYRRTQAASAPAAPPNFTFGEETLFETHRGPLRAIRRLLLPLLKLFFNPNPLIQALHIQSELNTLNAQRETARRGLDQLHFEVLHNLVIETTRMGIEVKNLKMRVESLTGRLEFNERRARALESAVVYRPSAEDRLPVAVESRPLPPAPPPRSMSAPTSAPMSGPAPAAATPGTAAEGPGQRSRRRRRRRGRRGGGSAVSLMGSSESSVESSPESIEGALSVDSHRREPVGAGGAPAPEASRDAAPAAAPDSPQAATAAPSSSAGPSDEQ